MSNSQAICRDDNLEFNYIRTHVSTVKSSILPLEAILFFLFMQKRKKCCDRLNLVANSTENMVNGVRLYISKYVWLFYHLFLGNDAKEP